VENALAEPVKGEARRFILKGFTLKDIKTTPASPEKKEDKEFE
jgi:hypothetical protein